MTPLAQSLGSDLVVSCDVEDIASVDAVFDALDRQWDNLDFVVHAIGFSDKSQLKGRYVDVTTRDNFSRTMVISCFSFTEIAQRAAKRMRNGGSFLTLTYGGSTRVMPNYNVMGVAKAALEASVRYIAAGSSVRMAFAATPSRRARPHARGRRHRRCPAHVHLPEGACAAAPHGHDRGHRRVCALPAVALSRTASRARSITSIQAATPFRCRAPGAEGAGRRRRHRRSRKGLSAIGKGRRSPASIATARRRAYAPRASFLDSHHDPVPRTLLTGLALSGSRSFHARAGSRRRSTYRSSSWRIRLELPPPSGSAMTTATSSWSSISTTIVPGANARRGISRPCWKGGPISPMCW